MNKQKAYLIFLGILLLVLFSCQKVKQADIAIQNVSIIDASGEAVKSGMTVLIRGNRIVEIVRKGKIKLADDTLKVDGSKKYLIPGLWDMHVHPYHDEKVEWKEFMALFIVNGVTSVRAMFGFPELHQWRNQIESENLLGPRMIMASPPADGPPPGSDGSFGISDAEEGRFFVRKSKSDGADFIKVYTYLPREAFFAIADEAKKQEIPFAGHVPLSVSSIEASDAGQQSLEHKYPMLISCSDIDAAIRIDLMDNQFNPREWIERFSNLDYNEQKSEEFFSHLVKNGTFICPTIVNRYDLAYIDKIELAKDTRLAFFPKGLGDWFAWRTENLINDEVKSDLMRMNAKSEYIVGKMNEAGVKLIAGTDTGSGTAPYIYQGFSLHDELKLLVKSGLTPMEAIQSATRNAADCVGKLDSLGTIKEDKIADLVLLDENPLSSIENTKKINCVIYNGKLFDRPQLDKILEDLKKLALER